MAATNVAAHFLNELSMVVHSSSLHPLHSVLVRAMSEALLHESANCAHKGTAKGKTFK